MIMLIMAKLYVSTERSTSCGRTKVICRRLVDCTIGGYKKAYIYNIPFFSGRTALFIGSESEEWSVVLSRSADEDISSDDDSMLE